MRLPVFALLLALLPLSAIQAQAQDQAHAQDQAQEDHPAYGVWLTDNGKSKVHVNNCDGKLCSTIIWLKDALDGNGQPHLDDNNQNPELRERPVVGLNVLDRMTQTARYEWEGEVYNPEDGKMYKAYLAMIKPDLLRLKGCMPMGWPCRSKFWKKLDEEPPAPPEQMMASPEDGAPAQGNTQLAEQSAVELSQQAQVTTQSVAEDARQAAVTAAEDARQAADTVAAAPPQDLTAPRQLTPPRQAQPSVVAPGQQVARIPEPPAPPAPPQLSPPVPPAPPKSVPAGQAAGAQADDVNRLQAQQAPAIPAPPAAAPPAAARSSQLQRQAVVAPPPPPVAFSAPEAAPRAAPRPRNGQENRQVAALPPQSGQSRRGDDGERYLVQVAARQNEREAMQVFYDLRQRNPQLLGNVQPIIKRVDLGDLGVWYRVRVGPITGKAAALAYCNRLKFAGSDCFIRRQ